MLKMKDLLNDESLHRNR